MKTCINAGGTPVGKDMYESTDVQSKNNTYWTSDFSTKTVLTLGAANNVPADLCGYIEYNLNSGLSEERFADCSYNYKYICCPEEKESSSHDCIHHGTWEKAIACNQDYSDSVFSPGIFKGKYWTRTAIKLTVHEITGYPIWDIWGAGNYIVCITSATFSHRSRRKRLMAMLHFFIDICKQTNIEMQNLNFYDQNIYQCGIINKGGTLYYIENCIQFRPSYCSFDSSEKKIPYMRVCSSPVSSSEKNPTKMQTSYMTISSTSTKMISPEKAQRTASQSTATRNVLKDSKMVVGVAVGVGVPVILAIVLIGLIVLRRRGIICRPPTKESEAHANAAYGMANEGVSFSTSVLSSIDNAHQHRDNEFVRTNNVYSRINIQNPKIKGQNSKAPYGKKKKRYLTSRDTKHRAQETKTQEYDNSCFKDSKYLVQRKNYGHNDKGTDEYNTTCLGNIQLPHDSDYNTLGISGVYNVADLRGNKVPNAVSTIANNGIYNTLANQEEDYNTVNLHRDNAPQATLRSDNTYSSLRNNTDDYNVVVLNGETNPNLMLNHDDTYNTLGRGTEEYNTVDYYRNTDANKSEDCYDHFH